MKYLKLFEEEFYEKGEADEYHTDMIKDIIQSHL